MQMDTSSAFNFAGLTRELHSVLVAAILAIIAYIVARWALPDVLSNGSGRSLDKFVGPAWPFFAAVATFLLYATGAWFTDTFALGASRDWRLIDRGLFWAIESCPMVGLLTTFLSLHTALLVYSEAGPGKPETQTAFIANFAIAFGSSITGGVLALIAFTLHQMLPQVEYKD